MGFFAQILNKDDKELRIVADLSVSCHWIPYLDPIVAGNVSIFRKLELEVPHNFDDFVLALKQHAWDTVLVA